MKTSEQRAKERIIVREGGPCKNKLMSVVLIVSTCEVPILGFCQTLRFRIHLVS